MRILLLGATGRTGKWVLDQALDRGLQINCIVRDAAKLQRRESSMSVYEGTPSDPEILRSALDGCHAVINVLNVSRKSDFPWAPLRTPDHFLSEVMGQLIPMAEETGVK